MSRLVLTVFFEDPFWVAAVESQEGEALRAARHVFGAEPSPGEVLEFVLCRLGPLLDRPGAALSIVPSPTRPLHPKRAARQAAREVAERGPSTQSQTALRLQIEQGKQAGKQLSKAERDAAAAYKRQVKLAKAKARHRGR